MPRVISLLLWQEFSGGIILSAVGSKGRLWQNRRYLLPSDSNEMLPIFSWQAMPESQSLSAQHLFTAHRNILISLTDPKSVAARLDLAHIMSKAQNQLRGVINDDAAI